MISTTDQKGLWPGLLKGTAWGRWDTAGLRGEGRKTHLGFCAHIISCVALSETLSHSGPLFLIQMMGDSKAIIRVVPPEALPGPWGH